MLDARFTFTMAFQGFNVKTRSDALRRRSMVQCWSGPHVPTAVIWKFLRLLQLRVFSNNPARNSTKKNGLHVSSRSCVVGPSRHPFSSRVSTFLGWLNYPWPRCWMRASPLASWETKVLACARWPRSPAVRCPTQPQGGRARCPGGCHHGFPGVGRGWCGGLLRWTSLDRSCCFAAF